jgi:hypothetical protein
MDFIFVSLKAKIQQLFLIGCVLDKESSARQEIDAFGWSTIHLYGTTRHVT